MQTRTSLSAHIKQWDAHLIAKVNVSLTSKVRYSSGASEAIGASVPSNASLGSGVEVTFRAAIHLAIHEKQCRCPVPQAGQVPILWGSPMMLSVVKMVAVAFSALTLKMKDRGDLHCALPDRNL